MKIRNRLALLFSLLSLAILAVFASSIYFSAQKTREYEFFQLLRNEALTKANLLFEAGIEAQTLQSIYQSNRQTIYEVELAIHKAEDLSLYYHDAVEIDYVKETPEMLRKIAEQGELRFYINQWQVLGMRYERQGQTYLLTVSSYDDSGYRELARLRKNILALGILSLILSFLLGRFFAKQALSPIGQIIEELDIITASSLDMRLAREGGKDELAVLAQRFNKLLARLEQAFENQKHFISQVAHELRTPLASIIADLELSLGADAAIENYRKSTERCLQDAQKLVQLTNNLLYLAKAEHACKQMHQEILRLDELALEAAQTLKKNHAEYKISLHIAEDIDERALLFKGNPYLLQVALLNLLDNACKFSPDKSVSLSLKKIGTTRIIDVCDSGPGIAIEEQEKLFEPFYRQEREHNRSRGQGIGLYLCRRIVDLHQALKLKLKSQPGQGSCFSLVFERNKN